MDFVVLGYPVVSVIRDDEHHGYWIADEFYSDEEAYIAELFPELLEEDCVEPPS